MQTLDDLISFGADVELLFSDGTLMASSATLGLFSSVLRGAVEANAGAAARSNGESSNNSSSSNHAVACIPLEGVTKAEWLEVASFWYPIVPAPTISGWVQAELLLKVAARFDISLVLHKVDLYLQQHASAMTARLPPPCNSVLGGQGLGSAPPPAFGVPAAAAPAFAFGPRAFGGFGAAAAPAAHQAPQAPAAAAATVAAAAAAPGGTTAAVFKPGTGPTAVTVAASDVWKWLHLADKSGLTICLSAIVQRAVAVDREQCRKDHVLKGLSGGVLLQLIKVLA